MKQVLIFLAGCLLVAAALIARAEARPLERQLPPSRMACWQRSYDAAHLARHPEQKVLRIRLVHPADDDIGPTFMELQIDLVGRRTAYKLSGFCTARGQGLDCRPEWDAGSWRVEAGPGDTLDVVNGGLVLNPDSYVAEERAPDAVALPAAPDDRRWRLSRLPDGTACDTY
jgi:hypothetical protein